MNTRPVAIARLAMTVAILLLLPGPSSARHHKPERPEGVIVRRVGAGSAGEKAGLKPGDLILSWSRAAAPPANPDAAGGNLRSTFELFDLEIEQGLRGPVTLTGERDGLAMSWVLPPGPWQVTPRPVLSESLLALDREATDLFQAKKVTDATERWRAAAVAARGENARLTAVWFLAKAANFLGNASLWTEADAMNAQVVEEATGAGETAVAARLLRDWAEVFKRRGEWDRAEECYRQAMKRAGPEAVDTLLYALSLGSLGVLRLSRGDLDSAAAAFERTLAIHEKLAPQSLDVSTILNNIGNTESDRGDFDAAASLYERSLAIRERLVPESLYVAGSLNNLGTLALKRGRLAEADSYFKRSLSITERLEPDGSRAAEILNNLGVVQYDRGDLAAAQGFYRRALAIHEVREPGGMGAADAFNNLGLVAHERGDLAAAEEYYRQSLSITEEFKPDTGDVAATLHNLGRVARSRGDLEAAESYFRRALAIAEMVSPGTLQVASELNGLGALAIARHHWMLAEEQLQRSLRIREKIAPKSLLVANVLGQLGGAAGEQGDHARAKAYLERALQIEEGLAPGSLAVADSLRGLAKAARATNDLASAEALASRSLAIVQGLAPGSQNEADSLHELGLVYRAVARPEAAATLCRAVDALELQKTKLGGTEETKSTFAAKYAGYYRDCLEALVKKGPAVEAFRVLERSRARSLLSMLAERDLLFASDVPTELAREQRLTAADYDRTQGALAKLNAAKDAEEIEALLGRLREIRAKQDEVGASIRKASPRVASLQYPEPLALDAARAALQPGTLLLSYSVGEEQTLLFAVQSSNQSKPKAPGLTVLPIPVGEEVLRTKVERFRTLIQTRDAASLKTLKTQAAELYDVVVKPVERLIASSQRVLISPDGPLHTLPFGALQRKRRYLAEWKPLHQVVSATVYAELTRPREGGRSGPTRLTAFGDPEYPAALKKESDKLADATVRSVVRGGFAFDPLPSSRAEVEGIGRLYPEEASLYLGAEATEERVKSTARDVRYLHFATHGLLNERFPLDSALVLTIPGQLAEGRDNGLLQAWEVLEKVRIDADLVVLSACETGLGKEMGGEGLVGLTRAFQYAGARSILASLWSVSDESTADLMRRFYTYLKSGKPKDEALRAAQVDLIHGSTASHPFHWAAFQLVGDWQ